ncbi:MAG: hypothetical protein NZM38_06680 [Cytophagales bacterium]|nr:hypothetical protein [Cytophagales bacterium]MDW8384441.1 hypothetical protein [Flammeovirgaceae bacterium]
MKRSNIRYLLAILNTVELVFSGLFTVPIIAMQVLFAIQIADIFFEYFTVFPDYQDRDIQSVYFINGVAILWFLWTIIKLYKRFPKFYLIGDIFLRLLFIGLCSYLYFNPFVTPLIVVCIIWMALMILLNAWVLKLMGFRISTK